MRRPTRPEPGAGLPGWCRGSGCCCRGMAVAATNVGGDRVVQWGCRSLAIGCQRGRTSTGELLAYLAGEDDPFVELLTRGSGIEADRYRLRLPEQVSLIRAGGPRLRVRQVPDLVQVIGAAGLLVYQVLDERGCGAGELAARSGWPAPPSTTSTWTCWPSTAWPGPARPAGGGVEARIRLYRAERRAWWTWLAGRLRLPRLAGRLGAVGSGPVPEPPAPPASAGAGAGAGPGRSTAGSGATRGGRGDAARSSCSPACWAPMSSTKRRAATGSVAAGATMGGAAPGAGAGGAALDGPIPTS